MLFRIIPGLIFAGLLAACNSPGSIPFPANPGLIDNEASSPIAVEATTITPSNPRWRPQPGDRLQIQFSGEEIDLTQNVEIYDLDLFETSVETIQNIHSQNKYVICYINAGAWEDWRPDSNLYPVKVLGNNYEGWPGEKWIDIREIISLEPILAARLDLCQKKGFDGVEPDNLDGYQAESGFPLSAQDQVTFNRWLADQAHLRRLSIGLKNDPDQIKELEPDFDFGLVEDCYQYDWCKQTIPFISAKKPVFAVEYTDRTKSLTPYCPSAKVIGLSLFLKNRDLDAFQQTCP